MVKNIRGEEYWWLVDQVRPRFTWYKPLGKHYKFGTSSMASANPTSASRLMGLGRSKIRFTE
jgi:hypothetical protein